MMLLTRVVCAFTLASSQDVSHNINTQCVHLLSRCHGCRSLFSLARNVNMPLSVHALFGHAVL